MKRSTERRLTLGFSGAAVLIALGSLLVSTSSAQDSQERWEREGERFSVETVDAILNPRMGSDPTSPWVIEDRRLDFDLNGPASMAIRFIAENVGRSAGMLREGGFSLSSGLSGMRAEEVYCAPGLVGDEILAPCEFPLEVDAGHFVTFAVVIDRPHAAAFSCYADGRIEVYVRGTSGYAWADSPYFVSGSMACPDDRDVDTVNLRALDRY